MNEREGFSRFPWVEVGSLAALLMSGCSSPPTIGGSGGISGGGGVGGALTISLGSGGVKSSGSGAGGTGGGTSAAPVWPPPGFINETASTTGAYALGPEISGAGGADGTGGSTGDPSSVCVGLFGVVRDFKMGNQDGGHPDFDTMPSAADPGIVDATLGSDRKPVYAHAGGNTPSTTGQAEFDQWYRDVPDVNRAFILGLHLVTSNGISTFSAVKPKYFFPLDGQGFGDQGQSHNFSFTTELHTAFKYNGRETFSFVGDDDVWVFIDNKLVIDLGGRHGQMTQSVDVDSLGLTVGNEYDLAVFHAERHTSESNFQIQTTLAFTDCGQVDGVIY